MGVRGGMKVARLRLLTQALPLGYFPGAAGLRKNGPTDQARTSQLNIVTGAICIKLQLYRL